MGCLTYFHSSEITLNYVCPLKWTQLLPENICQAQKNKEMIDIKFVLTMGYIFTFLLDTNEGIRETMGRKMKGKEELTRGRRVRKEREEDERDEEDKKVKGGKGAKKTNWTNFTKGIKILKGMKEKMI